MASENPLDQGQVFPERWAVHGAAKASILEWRLAVALAARPSPTPRQLQAAEGIRAHVLEAKYATGGAVGTGASRRRRRPWSDRWRGTSIEKAYLHLHAAETLMVELLDPVELDARAVDALARVRAGLPVDDVRRLQAEELLELSSRDPRKAAVLAHALEVGYEASDELHARVRNFRNILLLTALLITLLMLVFVVVVAENPERVSMCFTPSSTSNGTAEAGAPVPMVCASGDAPSAGDILLIAGLGLLGGALAAAFSIRRLRGTSTPYQIPTALALLKVPSGALTAVAGIILIGGEFVPGLSELDSRRQILAYALVLGYAQQLATRYVDDRAQDLLASVPSKESPPDHAPGRAAPSPQSRPLTSPLDENEPTRHWWSRLLP